MKLALISDIHGNAVALEAVLEAIEEEGVDRIVCLGDVAALGAQPRECVQRVHYPVAAYVKALRVCDMPHKELLVEDWYGA